MLRFGREGGGGSGKKIKSFVQLLALLEDLAWRGWV